MQLDPSLFKAMYPVPNQAPKPAEGKLASTDTLTTNATNASTALNTIKATPKTTSQTPKSKKKKPKTPTPKLPKASSDEEDSEEEIKVEKDKKPNHAWTNDQKTALLTLIIDQISLGMGTDNGNLKSEGWTRVAKQMHEQFNIKFERKQLKNQKGTMRKIYIDMKFLIEQSGFGWDQSTGMVTADEDTWDELIQAHPKKKFATLRANPISWYSLAHSLFTGTYATGVNAVLPGAPPPEQPDNEETSGVPPQLSKRRLPNKKEVKDDAASSSDDAAVVQPGRRTAPKRIRSSKYEDFKAGVESIVGAIRDVGSHEDKKPTIKIKDDKNKPTVEKTSVRQKALQLLSSMFLQEISTAEYVKFIKVVESESNAEVFLSLSSTTNPSVCCAWLQETSNKLSLIH